MTAITPKEFLRSFSFYPGKTKKIRLLGALWVKCGSVVQVEGSRSYKAIAFTSRKGNMRLAAKTYSEPRMSPQKENQTFPENVKFRVKTRFDISFIPNYGDLEWKK
jgi:hypothetical protein